MLSLPEFDSTVRRGLLLTYVGESTNDIFDILPDTGTTYQAAIDALTQHFTPQGNNDMAIFDFRELKQGVNETLNEYYRRLKTKAAQCNFHSEEAEIKIQIIHKTRDSRLRKKALRETMTLKEILDYGNTLERTDEQSKRLDNASKVQSENTVNYNDKQSKHTRKSATSDGATSGSSRNSIPSKIKKFRVKLQTGIVSLKPVATVGVNFHIKMAWNLVQLEGSNAIIVRKWDILLILQISTKA